MTREGEEGAAWRATKLIEQVSEVACLLQETRTVAAVGTRLVELLSRLPEAECGGLYVLNDAETAFDLVGHWGLAPDFVAAFDHVPVDSRAGGLLCAGEAITVTPARPHPGYTPDPRIAQAGIRVLSIMPLMYAGRALGGLNVASRAADELPANVQYALRALSQQIGACLARLRAEAKLAGALHENERSFRLLAEGTDHGLLIVSGAGRLVYANGRAARLVGAPPGVLAGSLLRQWVSEATHGQLERLVAETRKKDTAPRLREFRLQPLAGPPVPVEVRASHILWRGEDGVLLDCRDITARGWLQAELAKVSDWEKQRIGRQLHDGVAQQVAAAAYLCKAMEGECSGPGMGRLRTLGGLLQQCLDSVRRLARSVHPADLDVRGLPAALRRLAGTTTELFGVTCRLGGEELLAAEREPRSTEIYYIVQEAVMNAVRHGQPTAIDIQVRAAGDGVCRLEVRDDGRGLTGEASGAGIGMQMMRHRASLLGGDIELHGGQPRGLCVVCTLATCGGATEERAEEAEAPPGAARV